MGSALKIGSAILVAGGIATGVGFGIQSSLPKPKTNEEVNQETKQDELKPEVPKVKVNSLIDPKFRLLEQKEEEQERDKWDVNWNKFRDAYKDKIPENINSFWSFEDWVSSQQLTNAPDEFKNKCKKSNDESVTDANDPLFIVFRDYCLVAKEEAAEAQM